MYEDDPAVQKTLKQDPIYEYEIVAGLFKQLQLEIILSDEQIISQCIIQLLKKWMQQVLAYLIKLEIEDENEEVKEVEVLEPFEEL